ncbi:CST complex subunit TEN1 isoform X3 [Pristis pectinata]|uniref:CST complex subunit TEN1 isoform X3 n=1 Tax=Pristis pectinata TaxID=685728 RepID=UPI00223DC4BB|nr:CST complex subunit TEN1 isoform X3 [Pristis pectinata]
MRRIDRAATDFNSFASNSGEKGGKMLPQPGVFHFLWEICSGAADEGSAVRTFGRLTNYDARISEAALCVHHNSIDYSLRVLTSLVEPFEARVGAEYMVLGEMETTTDAAWPAEFLQHHRVFHPDSSICSPLILYFHKL